MGFQKADSAATKLFLHALGGEIQGVVQNKFSKKPVFVGTIDHDGGSSVIRVWDFNDLLRVPPSVDCDEPWVMKEESWHYEIHRSRFCWVYLLYHLAQTYSYLENPEQNLTKHENQRHR